MNTYKLTIATPDGNRFQGEVMGLFVRGAEGDLAVCADIHQQCQCVIFIKLRRQQAAYGIRANKARNVRHDQQLCRRADWQNLFARNGLCLCQGRRKGDHREILRTDSQK